MADFFKNALGMLGSTAGKEDNEFVGQLVEVGSQRLKIKKVIAEGKASVTEIMSTCFDFGKVCLFP